jgi:iron complex outermembrane receptor protein
VSEIQLEVANTERMSSRRLYRPVGYLVLMAAFLTFAAVPTTNVRAQDGADESIDEVTVTGSRRQGRSPTDMAAPVDIIGSDQLANQAPNNISELLRSAVPSFNVSEQPISGTATAVRPANLRGLSPDHVLILVNGKRRHRAGEIPTFGTALLIGSQGPDLASIPAIAIKEVHVLRDGAAAQYGADAIAGVINFVLRDDPNVAYVEAKVGQYGEGDGDMYSLAGTFGLPLGNDGFFTLSGEYSENDGTNRAREANLGSIQDLVDAGNTAAASQNVTWGAPELSDNIKLFANMAVDAGDRAELYGFGNYSKRDMLGGFFYRSPNDRDGIFTSAGNRLVGDMTPSDGNACLGTVAGGGLVVADGSAADQAVIAAAASDPNCFTWANVFPGGYAPWFGAEVADKSGTLGLRGETDSGWNWDVSAGFGVNELNFSMSNVTSPSFGGPNAATVYPDLGSRKEEDFTANVDFSKEFELASGMPVNVAFGAEWREEEWTVRVGQLESFGQGPLFDQGFASGTDGLFGYSPTSAGKYRRDNTAIYVDLEADVTERLLLGAAVRYEDFSDLGGETTGKLSGRFQLTDTFAIRGTASTGFHAPTPAQQNIIYGVTEGDGAGNLTESGIIPSYTSVAQAYGGTPAVPETATSLSIGLVLETDTISATLDVYSITVEDRISLSGSFAITDAQRQELADAGFAGADTFSTIQFFTNDFETETKGFDLIVTYPFELGSGSSKLSFAYNHNETEVTKWSSLTSDSQRFSLESGLPEDRGSLTWDYAADRWRAVARGNYYADSTSRMFGCCDLPTGSAFTIDLEGTFSVSDQLDISIGGQNILDELPTDISNEGISGAVGTRYAPETPWSFNGAFFYARAVYAFN